MSIELALDWKRGLALNNPILLASGICSVNSANVGALVTLPLTMRSRAGAPFPRVVELPGAVMMRTSAANPGLSHVLREHKREWEQSQIPILVAFASQGVNDWATMAAQLEPIAGVGGIELHLNPTMDGPQVIRALRAVCELPILAKLDLANAREVAADCVAAGANALVIGRAPRGMRIIDGQRWHGRMFGPCVKPIVLEMISEIADLKLAPIIACGGIHSAGDACEFLAAGAVAVEIDSAEWIEPGIADRIAVELNQTRTNANG